MAGAHDRRAHTPDARVEARLNAAFGALYPTLLDEAPERAAWSRLPMEQIDAAIVAARDRVGETGHALGFRTLLKQELDAACRLTPPVMSFEARTVPGDRAVRRREARHDERARDLERRAQLRRDELHAQAARLLRDRASRDDD